MSKQDKVQRQSANRRYAEAKRRLGSYKAKSADDAKYLRLNREAEKRVSWFRQLVD